MGASSREKSGTRAWRVCRSCVSTWRLAVGEKFPSGSHRTFARQFACDSLSFCASAASRPSPPGPILRTERVPKAPLPGFAKMRRRSITTAALRRRRRWVFRAASRSSCIHSVAEIDVPRLRSRDSPAFALLSPIRRRAMLDCHHGQKMHVSCHAAAAQRAEIVRALAKPNDTEARLSLWPV